MIENVTIVDKNGNGVIAEGISYFQYLSNAKKYITYTLNEKLENDLNKIYVSEITEEIGSLEKMPDEEWKVIMKILNTLSVGEESADIQFLNMNNATFNIGIPKKLAVTDEAKQTLKDMYFSKMIELNQQQNTNTPAVDINISNQGINNQDSIDMYGNSTPQNAYQDSNNINSTSQGVAPIPSAVNAMTTGYNVGDNGSMDTTNLVQNQDNFNQNGISNYSQNESNSDSGVVSREEALKALDTLNRYFKYTKELPSSLAQDYLNNENGNNIISFIPASQENVSYNPQGNLNNSGLNNANYNSVQQPYGVGAPIYDAMPPNNNGVLSMNSNNYINTQVPRMPDANLNIPAEIPRGNGYVATNNAATVNMNYSNGYVNDLPVALPANYNQYQMQPGNMVLGPGSLPTPETYNKFIA